MRQAGRADRAVKKNTPAVERGDVVELWHGCQGTLTQEEFCQTVGVSRTSLWRYGKGVGCAKPAGSGGAEASKPDGKFWQEAARALSEKHVTYGYRRMVVLLKRDGYLVGKHKVRQWMRDSGLSQ